MSCPRWRVGVGAALLGLVLSACGGVVDAHQAGGSSGGGGSTPSSGSTTSTTLSAGPDTYEAISLFTNLPRFAILKASPQRSLCFQVYVAMETGGPGLPGLSGSGLTVESALVTHDAADCAVSAGPPPVPAGPTHPVVSGNGTVALSAAPGCLAAIHAKLVLSGQPSWAPPSELLDADGLPVVGGCP